jgi:four helix bundle protein
MAFDHQKLDVYHRALESLELCDQICEHLPRGRAHVREQIDRAASSIVANVAEGAGEFKPKEKARFYRMARRSAIEVAAWLDIIALRGDAPKPLVKKGLQLLEQVVSMLVGLIKSCDR